MPLCFALALVTSGLVSRGPDVVSVGDGQRFSQILDAVEAVSDGGEVDVYPKSHGYEMTALLIRKRVTIRAKGHIMLLGNGFSYSGLGQVPRAIVQFEPASSGSELIGFTLTGAHNASFNGAGVRIRAANDITIRDCEIYSNDMGVMSNGEPGDLSSGARQHFIDCRIHDNGNLLQAGYNHNLYVSGASVFLNRCVVYNPLTGHNLKSRAHYTSVRDSVIYGGNNRQIDCVDSEFTATPDSDLLVYDTILATDQRASGNGNMIHFGHESGTRIGSVVLFQSTFFSDLGSPILTLDSGVSSSEISNCQLINAVQNRPNFVAYGPGTSQVEFRGLNNWASVGFRMPDGLMTTFRPATPAPTLLPGVKATAFSLGLTSDTGLKPMSYRHEALQALTLPGANPHLPFDLKLN